MGWLLSRCMLCLFLEVPAGHAAGVLMYIRDNQDNKSALNWQFEFWVETPPKKGFRTFPEAIKHRRRYFSRPIYIWIGKKSILLLKFWSLWTIPDNRCEFLIDHKIFKLKCSTRREIKNINVRKMLWIFFT